MKIVERILTVDDVDLSDDNVVYTPSLVRSMMISRECLPTVPYSSSVQKTIFGKIEERHKSLELIEE